ncbi:hypothetical protein FDJ44_gp40 [Microbacterium phage Pikmin]|uniref:Uncharacterized protein n=3 Tax=Pikminvirus pikmin TaxID=2560596 RepID=A0A2P1CKH3_9CAUD|nr:hypothetical protein FDJ44_gp40 [Microbacterium phage Pikmin]AVJ51031.1 hypothetical protein PBI_PAJAZA_40 [Microbacterium phage Pajaza]AVJ51178.1 hypothetical protein PBI_PIKMIN_40 [Microbacterium phage Pikmin]AVJ51736.1 hypothetical protein PBI_CASEY_40 [Microbacterium phage Casey]
MAKIIIGERPQIEKKSYAVEFSKIMQQEIYDGIQQELMAKSQAAGVPAEATLSREEDKRLDIVTFRWDWWELTI